MAGSQANANNLPLQLSSFIGRERELGAVKRLLGASRLVTLTGAGGSGKTRLSLQAAAGLLGAYTDGVWFVSLASLSEAALVPQAVATVLGVREQPNRTLTVSLAENLRHNQLLLILDNCEHLVGACAKLAESLLQSCPHLSILASSREALNIAGESVYRVPSLPLPDPQAPLPADLAQYGAFQLFVERATAARPDFALTPANAAAVAWICQRLDGMPLAIELAAAKVKVMGIDQIGARLDDRFRLLTGGSRTALPRHQTLRAAIDWSYNLLSGAERMLLGRLSVFSGGWTLVAVEVIGAGEPLDALAVIDLLTSLIDKSLVNAGEAGGETRYSMLETLRQFAREKLLASEEHHHIRDLHLEYFLTVAEESGSLLGRADKFWLDRLDREHDNMRSALDWCAESGQGVAGLRLADTLASFWYTRDYQGEGRMHLKRMLAQPSAAARSVGRASALIASGFLEHRHGDSIGARALLEESLSIATEAQDAQIMGLALEYLGDVVSSQGDHATASSMLERSVAIWRALNNSGELGRTLILLGEVELLQARYIQAQELLEESVALIRAAGTRNGLAWSQRRLAQAIAGQGDYRPAVALSQASLALNVELGDRQGVAGSLAALAAVAAAQGQVQRAARLYAAVEALVEAMARPLISYDLVAWQRDVAVLRATLDPAALATLWAEGRAMTMDQAIAEAQAISVSERPPRPAPVAPIPAGLTAREVEVLRLLAHGLTDAQIAETLVISPRTVNAHLRAIYSKLGVTTRTAAARYVAELKLS